MQHQFLKIAGLNLASLRRAIELNQADIRAKDPAFRSYIAGGELHTILRRPEFYSYAVGSRPFRSWIADVAAGRSVADVSCEPCEVAELTEMAAP